MIAPTPEALLYVLPWLRLREPLAFGAVELAPAALCLDDRHPCADAARRILHCYRDMGGRPVTPVLMWMADQMPLNLHDWDYETLELHRMCLAAGLICDNEYFVQSLGGITNSHCEGFLHRFTADGAHMGIYKRRREGVYLDGWPLDQLTITVPLPASPEHQLRFDQSLLDALVVTIEGKSQLGDRLVRALPPFLQGNLLGSSTTVVDDMVWMGAAFERLLGVTKNVGHGLAEGIRDQFQGVTEGQTSWVHISQSKRRTTESGPWRQRWMREFYTRRSSIHSGAGVQETWIDLHHGVIAAEVFCLTVKKLLYENGVRPLSDDDQAAVDALDGRIEALASRPRDPRATWDKPFKEARHRQLVASVAEALGEGDDWHDVADNVVSPTT